MTTIYAITPMLRCSFCNRTEDKVRKIVNGRAMNICDECVRICYELVIRDEGDTPAPPPAPDCA